MDPRSIKGKTCHKTLNHFSAASLSSPASLASLSSSSSSPSNSTPYLPFRKSTVDGVNTSVSASKISNKFNVLGVNIFKVPIFLLDFSTFSLIPPRREVGMCIDHSIAWLWDPQHNPANGNSTCIPPLFIRPFILSPLHDKKPNFPSLMRVGCDPVSLVPPLGRFEIISLSGSFLLSDNNGNRSRSGGLSVSLAGSDGRVLGGLVAGMLMAASPVQVIVGSFIAEGKKSKSNFLKSGPSSAPTPHMLSFGAPMTTSSPPSQGASSESSDDNGNSPLNRGAGLYNNAAQQPIHNMHMYQLWAGQTSQ